MKAVVRSIGGVGSRVRMGEHELVFDQPRSVPGGQDRGPSPLGVMAIAVAACAHYYAAAYLHGRGLAADEVEVDVEFDKAQLPVPRLGHVALTVRVPAALTAEQIAAIERAVRRCPAYGTLRHPPSVHIAIEGEPAREVQPASRPEAPPSASI